MMKRVKELWSCAAPAVKQLIRILGLYLDDLCLLAAAVCPVAALQDLVGGAWALLGLAGWLTVYALVIAKSRKGGGGK